MQSPLPKTKSLATPPGSSPRIRLPSPSKSQFRIPQSPHRKSSEAFWRQDVIMDWAEKNSPWKQRMRDLELERIVADWSDNDDERASGSPCPSPAPKSPSKTALKKAEIAQRKASRARRDSFNRKKDAMAHDFLRVLDDAVTGGKVQAMAQETGGVKIVWSKTLQTTAGRAEWKSQTTKPTPSNSTGGPPSPSKVLHHATIELAEKVIDCEDRLLQTFAHEYCHLANYMISNVRDQPHGNSFQKWGRKCEEALKGHELYGGRIEVTTKHSYQIDFKYIWKCVGCGHEYGRFSKSIKPDVVRCGPCKGMLEQIKPAPRKSPTKKGLAKESLQPPEPMPIQEVISKISAVSLFP
jgi:predicted SprT family Zn-dependent metalloprotease